MLSYYQHWQISNIFYIIYNSKQSFLGLSLNYLVDFNIKFSNYVSIQSHIIFSFSLQNANLSGQLETQLGMNPHH